LSEAANPNGATHAIAGIYSQNLRVLGLMPHPENLVDPLVGGTDGRGLFESLARALVEAA
jgi:phosphoribosylformylglycinamidine synthase